MKNPQTTIALTFLTHIISDIDGVKMVFFYNFRDTILAMDIFADPLSFNP